MEYEKDDAASEVMKMINAKLQIENEAAIIKSKYSKDGTKNKLELFPAKTAIALNSKKNSSKI